MTTITRTAVIAAGLALGAAVASPIALAAPSNSPADVNTVVSVEGPAGNVLMPMWQSVPRKVGTTTVVTDSGGQKVRMSAKSVAVQSHHKNACRAFRRRWDAGATFPFPWLTPTLGKSRC